MLKNKQGATHCAVMTARDRPQNFSSREYFRGKWLHKQQDSSWLVQISSLQGQTDAADVSAAVLPHFKKTY